MVPIVIQLSHRQILVENALHSLLLPIYLGFFSVNIFFTIIFIPARPSNVTMKQRPEIHTNSDN